MVLALVSRKQCEYACVLLSDIGTLAFGCDSVFVCVHLCACRRFVRNQVIFASTLFQNVCYHPSECQIIATGTDKKVSEYSVKLHEHVPQVVQICASSCSSSDFLTKRSSARHFQCMPWASKPWYLFSFYLPDWLLGDIWRESCTRNGSVYWEHQCTGYFWRRSLLCVWWRGPNGQGMVVPSGPWANPLPSTFPCSESHALICSAFLSKCSLAILLSSPGINAWLRNFVRLFWDISALPSSTLLPCFGEWQISWPRKMTRLVHLPLCSVWMALFLLCSLLLFDCSCGDTWMVQCLTSDWATVPPSAASRSAPTSGSSSAWEWTAPSCAGTSPTCPFPLRIWTVQHRRQLVWEQRVMRNHDWTDDAVHAKLNVCGLQPLCCNV